MRFVLLAICVCLIAAPLARAAPATQPSTLPAPSGDPAYDSLLVDLIAARAARAEAVQQMQQGLKQLVNDKTPESDKTRQKLLMRRRTADLQAVRLTRQLQIFWLEKEMSPADRKEFAQLPQADREDLLNVRSIEQRLAVPMAPAKLEAVKLADFLTYIGQETDTRIVADWPALLPAGLKPDQVITVEIAPFTFTGMQMLASRLRALSEGRARIDLSHARSVLVTTEKGKTGWAAMDAQLATHVADAKLWATLDDVQPPALLKQIPLADALSPKGSGDPILVDWLSLAELGLTPETPVDLNLGAHAMGHRLAAIAEGVDGRPAAKAKGGLKFDLLPRGGVLISSASGFARTNAAVTRLLAACKDDATLDLLSTDLPETTLATTLDDAADFLSDVTNIRVSADWQALGAVDLNPRTPVSFVVRRQPLCNVLALAFRSPPGKPPLEWEASTTKIRAKGPGK